MLDFLLSPFKAVYNLDTYLKATKQSVGKTLLFLLYILILFSVLFLAVLSIRTPDLKPFFEQIAEQVAQVIPEMTVKDGKLTANNGEYYEINLNELYKDNGNIPEGLNQKIVFDTERTEPVYPTQLQQEGIGILVTGKEVYLVSNGQVDVRTFDFDKDLNATIDGQYILDNKDEIVQLITKLVNTITIIVMPFIMAFLMLVLLIIAIIAVAVAQLFTRADVSFGEVCSICCYLLAPALFFSLIVYSVPFTIPFVPVLWFLLFMIYSQFILNKIKFHKNNDEE